MKKATTHRTFIRFRRWSRKRYAMFNSLGRCVTIGCLKKGVADASLNKQKSPAHIALRQAIEDCAKELSEIEEEICAVLFQFGSWLVQPQLTEETCSIESTEQIISVNELSRVDTTVSIRLFICCQNTHIYGL